MATFALISEGVTDQIILERMIDQICAEIFGEDVYINPLQPLRDATDAVTAPHGGWERALEYCEQGAAAALEANDYVVIHLDTDQGEHPNFGLPLTHQGVDRPYDVLVADAIDIIIERLGKELYSTYVERFLFAISVHSMESWLLLCLFGVDKPKNSFARLSRELQKTDQVVLVKTARAYGHMARQIKRRKLLDLSTENHSLGLFLTKLAGLGDTGG